MLKTTLTLLLLLFWKFEIDVSQSITELEILAGRDLSATPFSTDTNRFSDATSSQKAYDISSPHFPIYTGQLADHSNRYLHYVRYMQSAAEQGVAGCGAGDGEIEIARISITSQTGYEYFPQPNKTFIVDAAVKWNPSDFAIQAGEIYSITTNMNNNMSFFNYSNPTTIITNSSNQSKNQTWNDGTIITNANGYSSHFDSKLNCYFGKSQCRSYLKKRRRLAAVNWMSLVCGIGQYVIPLTEIQPGHENEIRWLPLDESVVGETIFYVGASITFQALFTGQLICFANDAFTEYWNNQGSIHVTVTRESWPPMNNTYYEDLYIPSCDSAVARYANDGHFTDGKDHSIKCNPS